MNRALRSLLITFSASAALLLIGAGTATATSFTRSGWAEEVQPERPGGTLVHAIETDFTIRIIDGDVYIGAVDELFELMIEDPRGGDGPFLVQFNERLQREFGRAGDLILRSGRIMMSGVQVEPGDGALHLVDGRATLTIAGIDTSSMEGFVVPEPGSGLLIVSGVMLLAAMDRKRSSTQH